MMTLISMGLVVAWVASLATELGLIDTDMWFELSTLVTVMLLGHWLEMRAVGQAQGALTALAALLPDEADRVGEHVVEMISVGELAVGDVVLVRRGARVPADGVIVEGEAELDESMITGESRPVLKRPGDMVVAGTVSTDSSLRVRVQAVGSDTAVAGIQRLVEQAQASRSRAQALADRFAALLFYVAAASGTVTFAVWSGLGHLNQAVERAVTVLVIACPHALGLAIPLTIAVSTSVAARAGILIKDRLALERMRTVDAVLFDKTGTLTTGVHALTSVVGDGSTDSEVLALAAAVEADSEHPLARAIVKAAAEKGVDVPVASGFRAVTGRGVEAIVDGEPVAVGGPALLRERHLVEPEPVAALTAGWRGRGSSVLHVVRDGRVIGALALEDQIRPESRQAVDGLHGLGLRVVMITGDARQVAEAVAAHLGVDEVMAEVLPEDKDDAVARLQARGLHAAMVV